jgi:GntR family transcriptional regulator
MGGLTQEITMPTIPSTSQEIIDDIKARIAAGEYLPGQALPSYRELAALYSVSTTTASRVYRRLNAEGVTKGVPGRAVFVAEA